MFAIIAFRFFYSMWGFLGFGGIPLLQIYVSCVVSFSNSGFTSYLQLRLAFFSGFVNFSRFVRPTCIISQSPVICIGMYVFLATALEVVFFILDTLSLSKFPVNGILLCDLCIPPVLAGLGLEIF